MGSLAGKSPANTYKSLLKVADETNGVTGTVSTIEDGEGTASSMQVSNNQFRVQPSSNTVGTLQIKNEGGSSILKVDTSNSAVLVGSSLVNATTQLLTFNAYRIVPASAGFHYFVGLPTGEYQSHNVELANGSGTDPSTTKDAGTSTQYLTNFIFPVPYNITIDSCKALISTHY